MRSAIVLVALAVLGAACGEEAEGDESTTASVEITSSTTPATEADTTTTALAVHTSDPGTTTSTIDPTTTSTVASGEAATIETEFGTVTYTVPEDAFADPRPTGTPPDFAFGQARWIVPDCCNLIVAVQSLEPPFPDEE